jgi:hypothetical protein
MLLPTGHLSLTACVHRVAERRDPDAAAQLSKARSAHKAIEPLLMEIFRLEELKRGAKKPAPPIPIDLRADEVRAMAKKNQQYREYQERIRAIPIPQISPEQLELRVRLRKAEARYVPISKEAQIFLRQSFGDGRLQAFCLRFTDGELEPIPAPRWWTRAADIAFSTELWSVLGPRDSRAIGHVLVRDADLETLLLPQGGSSPDPARSIAPLSNHAPVSASCSDPERLPPARRPSYSPEALGAWFRLREKRWPPDAPFPTEAEDLNAARTHFEGEIPRDPFREIRRNKTPTSWRKPGPRRARQ